MSIQRLREEAIKFYEKNSMHVIPIRSCGKKPSKGFDNWQNRDPKECLQKIIDDNELNLGLVLHDRFVVIDVDQPTRAEKTFKKYIRDNPLPNTSVVYRENRDPARILELMERGHIYFKKPSWLPGAFTLKGFGIEVRTGNQFCVTWPSVHPDGDRYLIYNKDKMIDPPELPESFYQFIQDEMKETSSSEKIIFQKAYYEEKECSRIFQYNGNDYEITEEFEEFLKKAKQIPIKDVADSLQMEKPKHNKIFCPTGHDKEPSFAFWTSNNLYHCFGCKRSGNTIQLVRLVHPYDNSFIGACRFLSDKFAIPLPNRRYILLTKGESGVEISDNDDLDRFTDTFGLDENILRKKVPEVEEVQKDLLETYTNLLHTYRFVVVTAAQASGKSYATILLVIQRFKSGLSSIYFSKSHDELDQFERILRKIMREEGLDTSKIFHLSGRNVEGSDEKIMKEGSLPKTGPIIILAPHAYLGSKGDTPFHYQIIDNIREHCYGDLLVIIDEMSSCINGFFQSFPLGARYSSIKVHDYKIMMMNKNCPLHKHSGNCENCSSINKLRAYYRNGLLKYAPLPAQQEGDILKGETPMIIEDKRQFSTYRVDDKTMNLYYIPVPGKEERMKNRIWSTGIGQTTTRTTLNNYIDDFILRSVSPYLIVHYPYNIKTKRNIGRALNKEELESRKNYQEPGMNLVPPIQTCDTYTLAGWDALALHGIKEHAKVLMLAPELSDPQKLYLQEVFGKEMKMATKNTPFINMKKVLILSFDNAITFGKKENKDMLKAITDIKRILFFSSTKEEAKNNAEKISNMLETVFYDGDERIRFCSYGHNDLVYRIYMSYAHGPISQGVNAIERICFVGTDTEIPKFVGRSGIMFQEYEDQSFSDKATTAVQCAGRIMRIKDEIDDSAEPRVIVFHGKDSKRVAEYAEKFFNNSTHKCICVHCGDRLQYLQETILRWIIGQEIEIRPELSPIDKVKEQIEANPQYSFSWGKIRNLKLVKCLSEEEKDTIKEWLKLRRKELNLG